jgi:hypothetical protein
MDANSTDFLLFGTIQKTKTNTSFLYGKKEIKISTWPKATAGVKMGDSN